MNQQHNQTRIANESIPPQPARPLHLTRRHLLQWGSGLAAGAVIANLPAAPVTAQAPVSPLATPPADPPMVDDPRLA
jgi:hypothetical protein